MRANEAWGKLEELVVKLAGAHPQILFTAIIDTYGRCSIGVGVKENDPVIDAANSALDQVQAPGFADWLAPNRVIATEAQKNKILKLVIEGPEARKLKGAPRAMRLSRLLNNESWRLTQPPGGQGWPKVVAFYSFKGGVGRSTAAAISALLMAREGRRVLLVDLDLEAPGLEGYFGFTQEQLEGGMVDLLLAKAAIGDSWSFDPLEHRLAYADDPEVSSKGGLLHIVPAGRLDRSYPERLGRLALADIARSRGPDGALRSALQGFIDAESYDLVMVDSRTGFSEIGGMALNGLADLNVLMFKAAASERRYVEVVLDQMARLSADEVKSAKDANELAQSLLFVFSMAQLPTRQAEAEEFDLELREHISHQLWERVFKDLPQGVWVQPSPRDEDTPDAPVPHDIVLIPYLRDFPALSRAHDMLYNATQMGVKGYEQLARRILDVKLAMPVVHPASSTQPDPSVVGDVVTALTALTSEVQAEVDLGDLGALRERFLPRASHRELLNPEILIIQGPKGSGKSALFMAFKHREFLAQLARHAQVSPDQQQRLSQTTLLIGFDEGMSGWAQNAMRALFKRISKLPKGDLHEVLRAFWRTLLCAVLLSKLSGEPLLTSPEGPPLPPLSRTPTVEDAPTLCLDTEVQSELIAWVGALGDRAKFQGKELWLLYDGLDAHLTTDIERRSALLSALVDLWWGFRPKRMPLRARIFLRDDLWENEVRLVDKAKLLLHTHRAQVQWSSEDLYRILIKRLLNSESFETLLRSNNLWRDTLKPQPGLELLGRVPPDDAEWLKSVILALVGEYMGATKKKGVTYNWLITHLSDARGQARPRMLLALFSIAAKAQGTDETGRAPLSPEKLRLALRGEVSKIAVEELREEFGAEWTLNGHWVPDKFKEHETLWPVNYAGLVRSLVKHLEADKSEVTELLRKMETSGLLERRSAKAHDRVQVPDIYLYGLGLTRKG
ncbi:P-loop ATPase, Sll1717 family [Nannocystis radixulma]|uniref:AAA family ATPase n=1 Tax=Nannocystis radixulma TaxID=2995305 RepID=A0ABT5B8W2_9BACT|nr:AAA family ATPase [Nannocystis radixulma]MDC0670547.1 AAA family ATPase [Nannocystis radixulma]